MKQTYLDEFSKEASTGLVNMPKYPSAIVARWEEIVQSAVNGFEGNSPLVVELA